jgi:hypothetical protein
MVPLYFSAKLLVDEKAKGMGGGRGYVAGAAIEAGELLLAEAPILHGSWFGGGGGGGLSNNLFGLAQEASALLPALATLAALAPMFPEHLEDATPADQARAFSAARLAVPGDGSVEGVQLEAAVARLALVLEKNLFGGHGGRGGLYPNLALFNHSGGANCFAMLAPARAVRGVTEVRATRPCQAGEALTISYLVTESAHRARLRGLGVRHGFCFCPGAPEATAVLSTDGRGVVASEAAPEEVRRQQQP